MPGPTEPDADTVCAAIREGLAIELPRDEVPYMITWESLAQSVSESRRLGWGFPRHALDPLQRPAHLDLNADAQVRFPHIFSMLADWNVNEATLSNLRQLLNANPQIDTWASLRQHLSAPCTDAS
ncbi:hypothetical protein [Mycobacterium sp. D16R24]|uniref:hypothetical protein n=1 Tax=Mycobacterium sp. D16R24 TaxID=1855656 RepID=UPI00099272FC|nr:hypothetical protein [Mycobacterium sp. D16R24]